MAQLTDIKNRFSTIVSSVTGINTFAFDVFSSINAVKPVTYPLFLLKVPSKAENPDTRLDWTYYNIEFYVLDLHPPEDTRGLAELYDEMQNYAEEVLIAIRTKNTGYRVRDKKVDYEYGYDIMNPQLAGIKCSFELGAFHCYEVTYAEIIRFIEDGTEYLYEDGTTKILG